MPNWNKPFNLVMELKQDYINKVGSLKSIDFETWLTTVNQKKYNEIFDYLQVNQDGKFILIRYGIAEMQRAMWEDPDSIFRECRSLVIDLEKEALVLTPFRKFFNINEVPENQIETLIKEIEQAEVVEIANKLDGSMQSARWYDGELVMSGSMALNPNNSWRLADGVSMLKDNYLKMLQMFPTMTFIFEYISAKDAHVVKYDEESEGLHLIGVRNTRTGEGFAYKQIELIAEFFEVKVVELENQHSLEDLMKLSKTEPAHLKEGWILNIDGHKIKIKCDDYVDIHRILDRVSSLNTIIKHVAEGTIDDLLSKVPATYRDSFNADLTKVENYVHEVSTRGRKLYESANKFANNRKEFMMFVEEQGTHGAVKLYAKNKYLNKETNPLKRTHRYCRINEINSLLNESKGGL